MQNYQEITKLSESISFFYTEHAIVDKDLDSIAIHQKEGTLHLPVSSLTCLMLGPGTSISHAAMRVIAQSGCMVVWCGETATKYYAGGFGETHSSKNLQIQAKCFADEILHMEVVRKMYQMRFSDIDVSKMTLQQIRGNEGIRVRKTYRKFSEETGVPWTGRSYRTDSWEKADPINRALSTANACLYGVCCAAIVSLGYSPGLGFIHTGKQLSFVYDIADLYKAETTIPAAFYSVKNNACDSAQIRRLCREYFKKTRLLQSIVRDISGLFASAYDQCANEDISGLWNETGDTISGGKNYGDE